MERNLKSLLLPFYFGTLAEEDRLFVEREMLSDSEALIDYLDFKRQIEAATVTGMNPSPGLWEKIKPRTKKQRLTWISVSVGAALAAGLILAFILSREPKPVDLVQPSANRILFDSSSELPASSGVL